MKLLTCCSRLWMELLLAVCNICYIPALARLRHKQQLGLSSANIQTINNKYVAPFPPLLNNLKILHQVKILLFSLKFSKHSFCVVFICWYNGWCYLLMTRLGSYLSPYHYKSRYNLYAGDMESPPLPSADFMQPKICFMDI